MKCVLFIYYGEQVESNANIFSLQLFHGMTHNYLWKIGCFFCERKYMSGILLMSWYFFSLNAHFGHIIYNIAIEFRYRNQMFIKLSFTAEFKRERANDDDACPFHQFVRTTNLLWGLLSNSSCYCTFITSFSAKRGHNGLKSFSNAD